MVSNTGDYDDSRRINNSTLNATAIYIYFSLLSSPWTNCNRNSLRLVPFGSGVDTILREREATMMATILLSMILM